MLAPRWVQPRLGALIRNEPAKRFYFGEFTNNGYIKGVRRGFILLIANRIAETHSLTSLTQPRNGLTVIMFEGLRNYFDDIRDGRDLISRELIKIVSPAILERVGRYNGSFIAINVRRGDLTNQGYSAERLAAEPRFTPDEWFIAALDALQKNPHWTNLPIYLFSDGTAEEIEPYIRNGRCKLVTTGAAIGDILLMSKAHFLVASGHSTFSMWASYLGVMPTIYYPGKMQQPVLPVGSQVFEGTWSPGQSLPRPRDVSGLS